MFLFKSNKSNCKRDNDVPELGQQTYGTLTRSGTPQIYFWRDTYDEPLRINVIKYAPNTKRMLP